MENIDKEELKEILKEIMTEVLAEQKYIYRTISPPEIVKSARGLMNLDGLDLVPAGSSKLARHINNRKILEAYVSRMSTMGFQLVTDVNYEGIPYGGNLVFRKPIKPNEEATSDIDDKIEPVITEGLQGDEIFFETRAGQIVKKEFTRLEEQEKKLPLKMRQKHERVKSIKKTINLEEEFKKAHPNRRSYVGGKETILYKKFKEEIIRRTAKGSGTQDVKEDNTSDEIEEDS